MPEPKLDLRLLTNPKVTYASCEGGVKFNAASANSYKAM